MKKKQEEKLKNTSSSGFSPSGKHTFIGKNSQQKQ